MTDTGNKARLAVHDISIKKLLISAVVVGLIIALVGLLIQWLFGQPSSLVQTVVSMVLVGIGVVIVGKKGWIEK